MNNSLRGCRGRQYARHDSSCAGLVGCRREEQGNPVVRNVVAPGLAGWSEIGVPCNERRQTQSETSIVPVPITLRHVACCSDV